MFTLMGGFVSRLSLCGSTKEISSDSSEPTSGGTATLFSSSNTSLTPLSALATVSFTVSDWSDDFPSSVPSKALDDAVLSSAFESVEALTSCDVSILLAASDFPVSLDSLCSWSWEETTVGLRACVPFTSWFVTSGSTRSCCGCFLLNHKKKKNIRPK